MPKLYLGCEVMVTENIYVYNVLANGASSKVTSIIINQQSEIFKINIGNNIIVKGIYAKQYQIHQINTYEPKRSGTNFLIKNKASYFLCYSSFTNKHFNTKQ